MSQTVVITGASGFIGSALLDMLTRSGYRAIGLSRKTDANKSGLVYMADYASYDPPEDAILVHLAERRDVKAAEAEQAIHAQETVGLCKALIEKNWQHIIYASSAEVYGYSVRTERRTDEKIAPKSAYAKTKQTCEKDVLNSGGTVLRLGNVYGRGMSKLNVISDIIKQIPGDGPLLINDTNPMRDFIWIEDVIIAYIAAINLCKTGIFNIGSGRGTSIGDLITQTLKQAGEENRPVKVKKKTTSRSCIVLDISETKRQLGWTPSVSLSEGLNRLLQDRHE